jgi:outer membrane protein
MSHFAALPNPAVEVAPGSPGAPGPGEAPGPPVVPLTRGDRADKRSPLRFPLRCRDTLLSVPARGARTTTTFRPMLARTLFAALVLAVIAPAAVAAPASDVETVAGTLSLEECQRRALREHPSLRSAAAGVEAARRRVGQAVSGLLPQVSGDYSVVRQKRSVGALIRGPGTGGPTATPIFNFHSGGFTLSQLLFDFGKTLNATRAALAEVESAGADRGATEQEVLLNVKLAYFDLIAARRLLVVAEETEAQNRRHLEEARSRYEVGVAPRFDVTQQEVQVANAELDALTARNNALLGRENLRNAIGLTAPIDFEPDDRALDHRAVAVDEGATVERAYARRPELRSVRARKQAQEERVAALQKDYLPSVTGTGNYSYTGSDAPEEEGWAIGAAVRLSIFNGGLTTAQVGEARAEVLRLAADEETLRQRVALEVRQNMLNLRRTEDAIRVSAKAVEQAQESLAIAEGRYSAGVGNIIELTDAQVSLASARANHVRSLADYRSALAQLERAVGTPIEADGTAAPGS